MALLVTALLTLPALAYSQTPAYGERRPNISTLGDYTPDSDEENCTCLSWSDAYGGKWYLNESANESDPDFASMTFYTDENDTNGTQYNGTRITYASCGQGHELSPFWYDLTHGQEPTWEAEVEYCDGFFTKLGRTVGGSQDFNDCVKIARDVVSDEWYGGSWCYVRKSCSLGVPLNESLKPKSKPGTARVKRCVPGEDSFLGDRTPKELFNISQETVTDMSTLVKMAYPTIKYQLPDFTGDLTDVQSMCQDDKPFVVDSNTSRPPFILQHGFSQYHILDNLDHMRVGRPHTYTTFKCANTSWQPCLDSVVVDEEVQKNLKKM